MMSKISLLQAENISKRYGDLLLFDGISLGISQGDKIAMVAKNGTGKSTLLKILSGEENPDTGKISSKNDVRVGYLPQEITLDENKTVMEAIFSLDSPSMNAVREYQECIMKDDQPGLQHCINKMDSLNAWDTELRVKQVLTNLKITQTQTRVGLLSGGEQKRVALAAVLLEEPDLLLLDEPTNHLDHNMIEWLEQFLQISVKSLFMVTHDRYFLDRICNVILELEGNNLYVYHENYSGYLKKRRERKLTESANVAKATNLLKTEEEWMRRMPKARGTKAKYRIHNYYDLKKKARVPHESFLQINVPATRLGNKVFELHHISKRYGENVLLEDFSYKLIPGEKIGITGDNGTGKTTFLDMLAGTVKPDAGTIERGSTVKLGYYRQEGISFKDDDRVIDAISKIAEIVDLGSNGTFTAQQFLKHFLFPLEKQQQVISSLSGGEKRRLYLCSVLIRKPNFLILDEPTNDLDIITLQVLEAYLMSFDGSVVTVSHDRFFMDKVVDHLFVFEGSGKVWNFPGNYSDYREKVKLSEKRKQGRSVSKKQESTSKPTQKKKQQYQYRLSYKEKLEFEALEKEIEALNKRKAELETILSQGSADAKQLTEVTHEYADLKEKLDEKEMRWLELDSRG
ncbi:MAG: ABC-F family ATP-binding cassette domain-containing protein [Candidatus Delongbacteria bacterium]|nr:ABC-F family ATP-binding cassette domain-containing protein [Candidatus Delongbacteria bacterium]